MAAVEKDLPTVQEEKNLDLAASQRFTDKVLREFGSSTGEIQITDYQRQLIQGYFIGIDRALVQAESKRKMKDNPVPYNWDNVNLNALARDIIHYARMGLDMMQPAHLYPIPYLNKRTNKYDMTLMPGYNGIQYVAEKYALHKPKAVTIELVYSGDTFHAIKKSINNQIEAYDFEIGNPFDRGEFVGGFGYIEYDDPLRNKLIIMNKKEIEKRKPKYASPEFWGGEKTKWENGKPNGTETVEGWYEEMCLKTIKREVFSAKHIPRDPKLVDDNYQYMMLQQTRVAEMQAQAEIALNANATPLEELPPANMLIEPGENAEDTEQAPPSGPDF